jgi:hypothetical protein
LHQDCLIFGLKNYSTFVINVNLYSYYNTVDKDLKGQFAATGGSGYEAIPEGIQSAGSVPSPQCSQALGGPTFLRLRTGKVSLTIILQIS